jgi:2-dehydro-3-deoxyphosphogluconate aldolase/(4S)-4-hydroxy-2-oxoglutarate aldolase
MPEARNIKEEARAFLHENPIVAVLVADDPERAVRCGQALVAGGVRAVELALRTPRALDCLEALISQVPDLFVVAGTVLTPAQADDVRKRGCETAVAPGLNPSVVRHALDSGMSFAPGIVTPSDIEAALELGCTTLKHFPAEPSGGMAMLQSMAGPYRHLGLDFIPLGGIRESHIDEYLSNPLVLAIGGSWICPKMLVADEQWDEIERRAREAVGKARSAR